MLDVDRARGGVALVAGAAAVRAEPATAVVGGATKLLPSDGEAEEWFGEFLSISGRLAVLGAHVDDEQGTSAGAAYLVERDVDGRWACVAEVLAPGGEPGDAFGGGVGISADTVLVGAARDDDLAENAGAAFAFEREACVLEIRLDSPVVRPGSGLGVYLQHRDRRTVTVPFLVWVGDEEGARRAENGPFDPGW